MSLLQRTTNLARAGLLLWALVAAGCSSDKSKPPPLGECVEPCPGTPGVEGGGGGTAGASGSSGASGASTGGAAGTAGAAGAAGATVVGVKVTGTLLTVTDAEFSASNLYPEAATVTATPADPVKPPVFPWGGMGVFELSNVAPGTSWIRALPTASTVLHTALRLQIEPGVDLEGVKVGIVTVEQMQAIYNQLPMGSPYDLNAGHVALAFVDAGGGPAAGVTVKPHFPAVAAYDDGAAYTGAATHKRGIALLLNAIDSGDPAVEYTTATGATGSVDVLLEGQQVSFLTVVVPPLSGVGDGQRPMPYTAVDGLDPRRQGDRGAGARGRGHPGGGVRAAAWPPAGALGGARGRRSRLGHLHPQQGAHGQGGRHRGRAPRVAC
jgi:hypothetical protein